MPCQTASSFLSGALASDSNRECFDEENIFLDYPLDLRLLQHDLGHEDAIGIARRAPGEIAAVTAIMV